MMDPGHGQEDRSSWLFCFDLMWGGVAIRMPGLTVQELAPRCVPDFTTCAEDFGFCCDPTAQRAHFSSSRSHTINRT